MVTTTALQAAVKEHGSISAAARALKIERTTLRRRLLDGKPAAIPVAANGAKAAGRSLADFRAQHDKSFFVPGKIRDALKVLGAGGWEYELGFARLAGVSLADLGDFREQFADHVVIVRRDGKRAWAGTPALAEKMRGMVR